MREEESKARRGGRGDRRERKKKRMKEGRKKVGLAGIFSMSSH